MKKNFDCMAMKREIQDKLWKEAGEDFNNYKKLLLDKVNNILYKEYLEKIKSKRLITA